MFDPGQDYRYWAQLAVSTLASFMQVAGSSVSLLADQLRAWRV